MGYSVLELSHHLIPPDTPSGRGRTHEHKKFRYGPLDYRSHGRRT